MAKKTITLLILDGWGNGNRDISNPIFQAKTPHIDFLKENYPFTSLQASGIAVGLPWNEPGSSEVGHLTIGAGQVIYQHYPRISIVIRNGSFFQNKVLSDAINFVKKNNSTLHIIGLLTSATVHASYEHLIALLKFCKNNNLSAVALHLFSDGRDGKAREAPILLDNLISEMTAIGIGRIATLIGRFYAMNHEDEWFKTNRAFNLIVENIGEEISDYKEAFKKLYEDPANTDEYLPPLVLSKEKFKDGDAAIFFNFREDGIRQLTRAFVDPQFKEFKRPPRNNIFIATFTKIFNDLTIPVAFPFEPPKITLTKILAFYHMRQLKITEAAKAAHVTYFFNGLSHEVFPLESRRIFPASEESIFKKPEMRCLEITDALIAALGDRLYDFIFVNLANPDMAAHTGDFELGVKTASIIDEALGRIYDAVLNTGTILIVTSDHGNLERMRNPETAEQETSHNLSPVPFLLVTKEITKKKSADEVRRREQHMSGTLADIAPTILELFGIPKPPEMTGRSLLGEIL